nr:uncharacterized protein LOC119180170 [Rhipicephalus microplus]
MANKENFTLIRNTDVDIHKLETDLLLLRAMVSVAEEDGAHDARSLCLQDYNSSFREQLLEFDSTLMRGKIDEVLFKVAQLMFILSHRTRDKGLPDHLTLLRWGFEEDIADILSID